jgi:hypothetical protein
VFRMKRGWLAPLVAVGSAVMVMVAFTYAAEAASAKSVPTHPLPGIAAPSPTSPTMTAAHVKAAGIMLRYPSSWTALNYTGLSTAQQKAIAKANPKLSVQAQTDAQTQAVKITKFYARDLAAEAAGEYASQVGVQVAGETGFPSNLDDFKQTVASGYKQIGGTVASATRRRIGGKTSYEATINFPLRLPNGSTLIAELGQLLLPHGNGVVVITVAAPGDATGTAVVRAILASVHGA